MSDNEFFEFCQANKELDFERDQYGNIIIMSPSGSLSDHLAIQIAGELIAYNKENNEGVVFGSSAGFTLPDSSIRSPDVAYVSKKNWNALTSEEKSKFAPVVPVFLVEVMSPSDVLKNLQTKMTHWMDNGVQLGWLIDPTNEKAYIYTPAGITKIVEDFDTILHGSPILSGFTFPLSLLRD